MYHGALWLLYADFAALLYIGLVHTDPDRVARYCSSIKQLGSRSWQISRPLTVS